MPANKPGENSGGSQPLLIDSRAVSKLLGRSVASIRRDDEAGRIPRPIAIGRSTRWVLKEIRNWVRAGCPPRDQWEARFPNRVSIEASPKPPSDPTIRMGRLPEPQPGS